MRMTWSHFFSLLGYSAFLGYHGERGYRVQLEAIASSTVELTIISCSLS
jgi:hypothetical protein